MDKSKDQSNIAFELKILRQTFVEWLGSRLPIDLMIQETIKEHKIGSQQRAIIVQTAYNLVRSWPLFVQKPLDLQKPEHSRFLNDVLRSELDLVRADIHQAAAQSLQRHFKAKPTFESDPIEHLRRVHGLSDFLMKELGVNLLAWHRYLHQMLVEAPVTVRVNPLKISMKDFLLKYKEQNPRQSHWVPNAVHFDSRWAITQDPGFQEGYFEIQDENSQLVSLLAAPTSEWSVLDLCAGAGGKSLHMATLMEGRGEIIAYDLAARKLGYLGVRARRAGFNNIRTVEHLPRDRKFDLVLVDAPCSGLGTLRRSPDRLMKFSAPEAQQLATIQAELLLKAKDFVKPGGLLVYATCTVRTNENWGMIQKFIARYPNLNPVDLAKCFQKNVLTKQQKIDDFMKVLQQTPAAQLLGPPAEAMAKGCVQLGPTARQSETTQISGGLEGDGFFIALVN